MSHYFVENPDVLTNERELKLEIFGREFRFLTNNGLFSCDKIDEVSLILIKNMPPVKGTLLDLGCGYGVIGIVLASVNNVKLVQSDVNRVALGYAVKNAMLNNVETHAVHSDSFASIEGKFDNITLNPPIHAGKDVMYRMYEEAALFLNPGGSLFVVIQKKHGAESTFRKLTEIFSRCDVLYKKKGCFVLRGCV